MVEDSALMREVIGEVVNGSAEFEVVANATTGYEAIRLVHEADPAIVTLDLEMPDLGGLETLRYIMAEAPRPVVILSGCSPATAEPTLRALDRGAVDFVMKPAGDSRDRLNELRSRLLAALRGARLARLANLGPRTYRPRADSRSNVKPSLASRIIAMAASTGGPRALAELLPRLPASLDAAIIVVQHMPAMFTTAFAERLDRLSRIPVAEAENGVTLRSGQIYLAPGGRHLAMRRDSDHAWLTHEDNEPVCGVRPSADVLFRSVASRFGPQSLGIVLSGMGRDGTAGLRVMRAAGGTTITQDEATSVLFGMPKHAAEHAMHVLALSAIPQAMIDWCGSPDDEMN